MNLFSNLFSNTCTCRMMENLVKFSNEGFMLVASVAKGDRHILINYCVVPDNIHSPAPPHGGQRKFRGEGGGGGGGGLKKKCPSVGGMNILWNYTLIKK